jgi:hypothetical protein
MISGASDALTIRERVRAALSAGTLPSITGIRPWVGLGTNRPCRVCGEPIHARQVEHEVFDTNVPMLLHVKCLHVWREESLGQWRLSREGRMSGVCCGFDSRRIRIPLVDED